VPTDLKPDLLEEIFARSEARSVIVFTRSQQRADRLARELVRRGRAVTTMHGNRSHTEREHAIEDLKRGRIQLLIATDIASRAIDVDGIPHVVNFDVPLTPEDYVHRLGRSGRTSAHGDAFTLMSPEEQEAIDSIERFLGRSIPRVLLPDFNYEMSPTEFPSLVSFEEEDGAVAVPANGRKPTPATAERKPAAKPVRSTRKSKTAPRKLKVVRAHGPSGSSSHAPSPRVAKGKATARRAGGRR
jgi:ATP-dependent RNA helicase RhlE